MARVLPHTKAWYSRPMNKCLVSQLHPCGRGTCFMSLNFCARWSMLTAGDVERCMPHDHVHLRIDA